MARLDRFTAGALASLGLAACEPPASSGRATAPPLHVELAGCAAVRLEGGDPVCAVTPDQRTLRLWIESAGEGDGEAPPVQWRNRLLSPTIAGVRGGRLLTVALPSGTEEGAPDALEIPADPAGKRGGYRLRIEALRRDPRLEQVKALRREGKLAEARAALPDPATLPEPLRGRAEGLRARIDLAEGRVDAAIAGFQRGIASSRRDGRASDEALDGFALAFALASFSRRFGEARATLASLEPALAIWDEGRAQLGYYRAIIDRDTGDLRAALRGLAESEAAAARLALVEPGRAARQARAMLLVALGRNGEAIEVFDALLRELPESAGACGRAEILTNRGWAELSTLESDAAGTAPTPALTAILERTVALRRESCPFPAQLQNAEVNLALAALLAGDVETAARRIASARSTSPTPLAVAGAWLLELEARVALAQGRPRDALLAGEALARSAEAGGSPEAAWQAAAGRGRALAALGAIDAAIAAYREAEAVLDRQGLLVPLGAGRASFLGDRERSARELINLLLAAGRPREALTAARAARARALAAEQRPSRVGGLAPRDRARWDEAIARYQREREHLDREADGDWRLAAARLAAAREERRASRDRAEAALDEAAAILAEHPAAPDALAEPREGELVVAFFPAGAGRYHLFAADRDGVSERLIADPSGASPEALAAAILAPIADAIDHARRLRVLAYGPFQQVDVHALPFRGAPLLARIPVEYGLDLPAATTPPRRDRALVVADTRDDLPEARGEAAGVARALTGPFKVASLRGEDATRAAILEGLRRADLFHFAGHGIFAGPTGWDSGLELADGARLSLGDVLAEPRVPALIVLDGCETGRTRGGARGADPGLAHAFITAGAEAVIAAVRPVDDRLAGALAAALYEGATTEGWDLVEALRRAQLTVGDATPDRDWAAYRIITR